MIRTIVATVLLTTQALAQAPPVPCVVSIVKPDGSIGYRACADQWKPVRRIESGQQPPAQLPDGWKDQSRMIGNFAVPAPHPDARGSVFNKTLTHKQRQPGLLPADPKRQLFEEMLKERCKLVKCREA